MTIGKLVFLLAVATAQSYALTSPNAPPGPSELHEQTLWEKINLKAARLQRYFFWPLALAESAVALATSELCPRALSERIIHLLVRGDTPQSILTRVSSLTPSFLVGGTLILTGSLVRIYCYRVLGLMFTFELSIRRGHKLITSGPYSLVRHPSYTGGMAMALGIALCQFTRQSWLVNCSGLFPGSEPTLSVALVGTWVVCGSLIGSSLVARMNREEAMLAEKFGDEWKEWAKRVPYRLVPGLY